MASSTRSRNFGRTVAVSLITCDTVPIETLARSAICRIVTVAINLPVEATGHARFRRRRTLSRDHCQSIIANRSLRVYYATEASSAGAVHTGGYHQQLAVLVQFVGLRKVPDRALRLIVAAAAKNASPGVFISKLFRPLPDISHQIHYAEWAGSLGMCIDRIRTSHGARLVRQRHGAVVPLVTPRIEASIGALGCVLPFPFGWEALSSPTRIGPRVFLGDPGHRFVPPFTGIGSVLPVAKKIQIIFRVIVGRIQKLLELIVGHRILIDVKRLHLHGALVKTPRRIPPGILYVNPNIIEALNLDSGDLKKEIVLRVFNHPIRRAGCGSA